MKRFLSIIVCLCAVLCVSAQDSTRLFKFGYLSYEKALQDMPLYEEAQQSLKELRTKYDAEMKRVEQDFNLKYEEFLDGQRDFPESILRKRQTELKELLEHNIAFRNESRKQLAADEERIFAPLKELLNNVLERIALENGYAFILNTDAGAVPFINPAAGVDVSEQAQTMLKDSLTIERDLQ